MAGSDLPLVGGAITPRGVKKAVVSSRKPIRCARTVIRRAGRLSAISRSARRALGKRSPRSSSAVGSVAGESKFGAGQSRRSTLAHFAGGPDRPGTMSVASATMVPANHDPSLIDAVAFTRETKTPDFRRTGCCRLNFFCFHGIDPLRLEKVVPVQRWLQRRTAHLPIIGGEGWARSPP